MVTFSLTNCHDGKEMKQQAPGRVGDGQQVTFSLNNGRDHKEMKQQAQARIVDEQQKRNRPMWLEPLLRCKFFVTCQEHIYHRKNELNTYCTDCDLALCQNCIMDFLPSEHRGHRLLQIRRYVYQNVVRVQDIQKLIDCSLIQPFTVNGAKVVLLNPKRNSKALLMGEGRGCEICQKSISEPNRFCSISCKISDEDRAHGVGLEFPGQIPLSPRPQFRKRSTIYYKSRNCNYPSWDSNESSSPSEEGLMVPSSPALSGSDSTTPGYAKVPCTILSFRKRKRKGTPRRAAMP